MPRERKFALPLDVRQAIQGALLRVRSERGLTQEDLEPLLGFTQQAIDQAEKQRCGPAVARAVYKYLDATEEQLVGRLKRGEFAEFVESAERAARARASGGASETPSLSPARRAALEAENWDDMQPGEYEFVHEGIATHKFNLSHGEPVAAAWRGVVKQLRAEFRGKHQRDVVPGDIHTPDSRVEAEKARRRANKKGDPR